MSSPLRSFILLWIVLFSIVSFFHSCWFDFSLSQSPSFYSSIKDIITIGFILTFASIAVTFLLFVLQVYLITKLEQTTKTLILINVITLVYAIVASFFVKEGTASWSEAFVYVGSYLLAFLYLTNSYFLKLKRTEIKDPNLLDQLDE